MRILINRRNCLKDKQNKLQISFMTDDFFLNFFGSARYERVTCFQLCFNLVLDDAFMTIVFNFQFKVLYVTSEMKNWENQVKLEQILGSDTLDGGNSGLSPTIKLDELYFLSLHLMIVKIKFGSPKNSQKNLGRKLNLEFDPYLNSPSYRLIWEIMH